MASIEEIKENDYNLNIPRYVDTFEEEEPIDLEEINKQLEQDNKEIAELEAEINKRKTVEYYEEMSKKYSDNPKLAELVAELKGLGE